MSGPNQHYIPQSLLRSFGTRAKKGKPTRVAVYKRDSAFVTATTGAAAQRYFFSRKSVDGSPTLDDEITRYESRLATILQTIQVATTSSTLEPDEPSELIAHLCVRNAQLRESFARGAGNLFEGIMNLFSDSTYRWKAMGLDKDAPSGPLLERINELYDSMGLAARGLTREFITQLCFDLVKSRYHPDNPTTPPEMEILMQGLQRARASVPEMVADAHRQSLARNIQASGRTTALRDLTWFVHDVGFDLVLPDAVAIDVGANDDCRPFMYRPNAELSRVLMPVSIRRVLVGVRKEAEVGDLQDVNCLFARCSWEFFITRERSPAMDALRGEIGTQTRDWMDVESAKAIAEQIIT